MPKETSRQDHQRRLIRSFWEAAKLRDRREAEAAELRTHALNAVTKESESRKTELASLMTTIASDQEEIRARLLQAGLAELTNSPLGSYALAPSSDDPHVRLKQASQTVREKKASLLQSVALLQKYRADARRRRPIACCMIVAGIPMIVIVVILAFMIPQLGRSGPINTVRNILPPGPSPESGQLTPGPSDGSKVDLQETPSSFGQYAEVSNEVEEVNLRRLPGHLNKDDRTDVIARVPHGEVVEIVGKPEVKDGLTWWNVSWNRHEGWIADHTKSGRAILMFSINGYWEGTVTQPGYAPYSISLTLTNCHVDQVCGSIEYPDLSCGGTITFLGMNDTKYRLREKITYGTNKCVNVSIIDFEPIGGVRWSASLSGASETYSANATLTKLK